MKSMRLNLLKFTNRNLLSMSIKCNMEWVRTRAKLKMRTTMIMMTNKNLRKMSMMSPIRRMQVTTAHREAIM
jgi:hypothetical protein